MKGVLIGVAIAVAVIMGIVVFTAQGAPSPPQVQISSLNPNAAQSVTLTFTSNVYSVQPPNSIDLLGAKVVYTVWQNNVTIVRNATTALGVVGSPASFLYTVQGSAVVSLPALCAASGCTGQTEKVSVQAQAQVSTYTGLYPSSWTNVTFTPGVAPVVAAASGQPTPNAAPSAQFAFNTFGAALFASSIAILFFGAIGPKPLVVVGTTGIALVVVLYLVWVVA